MRRGIMLRVGRTIPRRWFTLAGVLLIIYVLCTHIFTKQTNVSDKQDDPAVHLVRDSINRNETVEHDVIIPQIKPPEQNNIPAEVKLNIVHPEVTSRVTHVQNVLYQRAKNDNPEPPLQPVLALQPAEVKIPPLLFGTDGLGQNGAAVIVNRSKLNTDDQNLYDQGYKNNDFNEYISNRISVDRTVPETRDPLCLNKTYPTDLPDTSVIITFLNEAWSVLVRSVHSVINTSPPHLLREIILVDDFSDYDYLKAPLELYMRKFPKVKIVRNERREGLIRTRLNGAKMATGKVLTFLDSHIECAKDWLPPLLSRIKENASHVVWPVVPTIDRHTFQFTVNRDASTIQVGVFNWNMVYTWELPRVQERDTPISPIRSPTMAGGLFSIDRDYFYYIGSYDEQMLFWGAENLEMSFRIWMCGGTIEVIPCSYVGHVFRTRNVNAKPSNTGAITLNNVRTAMVWMDQYKHMYSYVANVKLEHYGNISSRLELRKNLQCKSFDWYLDNVYTNVFKPQNARMSGQLHNVANSSMCLHAVDGISTPVHMSTCNTIDFRNQVFYMTVEEELRLLGTCVDVGKPDLMMYPCHKQKGTQQIQVREDHSIFSSLNGKCLEWIEQTSKVELRICNGNTRQLWVWEQKGFDFLLQQEQNKMLQ